MIIDDSLQRWLDEDAKGSDQILCQNITKLEGNLDWKAFVSSGALRLVEEQLKAKGDLMAREKGSVSVITRIDSSVMDRKPGDPGQSYVISRCHLYKYRSLE